jgi:hypothetical protein
MSKFVSIFLGLFLALAINALAQSTGQAPTNPDAQSQSAPAAPSASQPTQNSPNTQGSGAANPQSTAPPSANEGATREQSESKGVDIDQELQLTDDQKQKIATVVDDENRQIAAVRDDNSISLQQKQQKVLQIRQAGTPKIKAILTPEQLQKLVALQQRMRDQQSGAQTASPSGNQSTPQNAPQQPPQR